MGDTKEATIEDAPEFLVSTAELLATLKCPICEEILLPPIYFCSNRHNVCSHCKTELNTCGLCQAKLTDMRNYTIESVVGICTFKCKNAPAGCPGFLKGKDHSNHLKICPYRPIPCYECGEQVCTGTMIPFRDYFTHLKDHHEITGEVEPSDSFVTDYCHAPNLSKYGRFPSFFVLYDDQEFLSNIIVQSGIIYLWLSIIANEDVAVNYKARLELYKYEDADVKLEWTFPVHSVRKQLADISETGLCAAIPLAFMQPFWKSATKEISWTTKYTIEKREEILL